MNCKLTQINDHFLSSLCLWSDDLRQQMIRAFTDTASAEIEHGSCEDTRSYIPKIDSLHIPTASSGFSGPSQFSLSEHVWWWHGQEGMRDRNSPCIPWHLLLQVDQAYPDTQAQTQDMHDKMDGWKEKGYVDARGEIYRYRWTDRQTDT